MPRIIPVLFLKNGHLVRSESFDFHQNLGNPLAQVERYNDWNVDELIYIDITKDGNYDYQRRDLGGIDRSSTNIIRDIINLVSKKCFMPLTFGGGIKTLEDARLRLELGADKITVNSQALKNPNFITELAHEFGSQAVVVSIDAKLTFKGGHTVFSEWGEKNFKILPYLWAKEAQERGAGEIFINSIDRDGKASGYDKKLIKSIVDATEIPVIACGGVGSYDDFLIAIDECGSSAAAAGNIFHFRELAYPLVKKHLKNSGLKVR